MIANIKVAIISSDGTSRDPFSYRRECVDETLSRPDEICLLNKNETLHKGNLWTL